jgi:hypothetical protein
MLRSPATNQVDLHGQQGSESAQSSLKLHRFLEQQKNHMSFVVKEYYLLKETIKALPLLWKYDATTNYIIKTLFLSFTVISIFDIANRHSAHIPYLWIIYPILFLIPTYSLIRGHILSLTYGAISNARFVRTHYNGYPRQFISHEFIERHKENRRPKRIFYIEYYNKHSKFVEGHEYKITRHALHRKFFVPLRRDLIVNLCIEPERRRKLLALTEQPQN